MRDGGKGDKPRPLGVTMEQFDSNFDAIFEKKKEPQNEKCNGKYPCADGKCKLCSNFVRGQCL